MNKILVALDNSPQTDGVLAAAIQLAKQVNGKVMLYHVVSPPVGVPMEAYAVPPVELGAMLERVAHQTLRGLGEKVPKELLLGTSVDVGIPWQCICDLARKQDFSVIVMGAHGYSTLDRMLGTTAGRVVTHADRSVLVVRQPQKLMG